LRAAAFSVSEPWAVLAPPEAVHVRVPPSRRAVGPASERLRELPEGSSVVLSSQGAGAAGRLRRAAARAGLRIERSVIVLPSLDRPAFCVEDAAQPGRYLFSTFLTAPPSGPLRSLAVSAVLQLIPPGALWRAARALAPGRVTIARR